MPETSDIQTFRRKPERVQAVQWRGDNAAGLTAFAGSDFDYDTAGDGDVAVRTSKHSSWEPLYIGDWAVRGPDGSLARVDAQDFAGHYEPAAATTPAVLPEPDFLPGYPGKLARPPAAMLARSQAEPLTGERIATYFLDHCGSCRDAVFYGYSGNFARDAHAKHVPVIEDGCGPLAGLPCACETCVPAGTVDA